MWEQRLPEVYEILKAGSQKAKEKLVKLLMKFVTLCVLITLTMKIY